MRVNFRLIIRWLLPVLFVLGLTTESPAQSDPDIIRIDYGKRYQLQDSYSILYDNPVATAKLKEFRIVFYDPEGRVLLETATETHPVSAYVETYRLGSPVSGFSEVGLSVLSLHSGTRADFPTDIGAILGLSEMTEVPDLVEIKPDPIPPAPMPPAQTLSPAERARLAETNTAISALLSALNAELGRYADDVDKRAAETEQLDQLIQDTSALPNKANTPDQQALKRQVDEFSSELTDARDRQSSFAAVTILEDAKTQALALQSQMQDLFSQSETESVDTSAIIVSLTVIEDQLDALDRTIAETDLPEALSPNQFDLWDTTYRSLNSQFVTPVPPTNWPLFLALGLTILIGLGGLLKLIMGTKAKTRPPKSILKDTQSAGIIFPASPMLAGNVAAPLSAAGQLTAAQLQMLTGPYAHLRDGYQATGRIGYAQQGVPSAEDYAFGTGFLISDRHVITNRHVHGLYGHYLLDEADPGGIEFIAEKGKATSDFVPFNCEPPLLLPALDIAIYTLVRPVTNRIPIAFNPVETERLDGQEIVVIGYPDTHTPELEDIKAVVEENAVFAVKRISQGQIFRHSTDTDIPFGVETSVADSKSSSFEMPAICHNASTLGGNSGSPLLNLKTGEMVGVHFAGFKVFNREEAANLAMAIAQLTDETAQKHLLTVTKVTA